MVREREINTREIKRERERKIKIKRECVCVREGERGTEPTPIATGRRGPE